MEYKSFGKFKNIFCKDLEQNNKKKIENLVVFIILLILTVVIINFIWKDDEVKVEPNNNAILADNFEVTQTDQLSSNLEEILQLINGVGKVDVLITYSKTNKFIPIYNESLEQTITEETDTQGGTRMINENNSKKEVVFENGNVITECIINPEITGAIITAEGANDAQVKTNIVQAVEAATRIINTQNTGFSNEINWKGGRMYEIENT